MKDRNIWKRSGTSGQKEISTTAKDVARFFRWTWNRKKKKTRNHSQAMPWKHLVRVICCSLKILLHLVPHRICDDTNAVMTGMRCNWPNSWYFLSYPILRNNLMNFLLKKPPFCWTAVGLRGAQRCKATLQNSLVSKYAADIAWNYNRNRVRKRWTLWQQLFNTFDALYIQRHCLYLFLMLFLDMSADDFAKAIDKFNNLPRAKFGIRITKNNLKLFFFIFYYFFFLLKVESLSSLEYQWSWWSSVLSSSQGSLPVIPTFQLLD